ncbi:MAG: DUF418 domain-containing protein [Phycisphaerales bacterium]
MTHDAGQPQSAMDAPQPVAPGARIQSIDVLRGVALLGILVINIVGFGLPFAAMHSPLPLGESGPNLWVWAASDVLINGSMFAIFSMLFGAGVLLFTRSSRDAANIADRYYRRTIWLILFGLAHAYLLLMPGDILFSYGVVGLFLFPLRRVRPWLLIAAAVIIIAGRGVITSSEIRSTLDAHAAAAAAASAESANPGDATSSAWRQLAAQHAPNLDAMQGEIDAHLGDYRTLFRMFAPENMYLQSMHLYTTYFWEVLSMMLLGMGLHGLGIFSAQRPAAVYCGMILIGYGVGLAGRVWLVTRFLQDRTDPLPIILLSQTYDTRLFIALGHIGVVMLLCRSGAPRWLLTALAAAGRMALTNYLMQTIICVTFFSGFGLGQFASLERFELLYLIAAIWAVQLSLSPLWLRIFRFGPAEWLWRSLTYSKPQPLLVDAERRAQRNA